MNDAILRNTIIPATGVAWLEEDKMRAHVKIHEAPDEKKSEDWLSLCIKWLAFDKNGKDVSQHLRLDYSEVDATTVGSYKLILICNDMITDAIVEVAKRTEALPSLFVNKLIGVNPKVLHVPHDWNPQEHFTSAVSVDGVPTEVVLDNKETRLEVGKHTLTWTNPGYDGQSCSVVVHVKPKADTVEEVVVEQPTTEVVVDAALTDGFGSYGNPPSAASYEVAALKYAEVPEEMDDNIKFLEEYEDAVHPSKDPSLDLMHEQQIRLFRHMLRLLNMESGFTVFTTLLDRFHQVPDVYSELMLTRVVADLVPDTIPAWYFKLLWLLTKASDPVNRVRISDTANYNSLLQGIPNTELDFITQYFASVSIATR